MAAKVELLGQLFFQLVLFRAARGDPFQHIGIHNVPKRWSRPDREGPESTKTSLPDELHGRRPPAAGTSTPKSRRAGPSDQHVRRWRDYIAGLRSKGG
ncbi:hypothetical protein ACFXKJ_33660 [Kitasatospora indigofera]|uniref:hypothetical protein n=1 Tax=Kitasatospora indigofera TaxID=67307 RepID=UPI0036B41BAA